MVPSRVRRRIEARAKDAVSRMTVQEKICNLDTGGCPIKGLGIPAYNWWSEASTGVASGRNTQTTKFAFPPGGTAQTLSKGPRLRTTCLFQYILA